MNDNGIPGTDHPNFRLFSDGTEVWAANTLAYVIGGGPGAWVMQDVDAAHGLPVALVPGHSAISTETWDVTTPLNHAITIPVKGLNTVLFSSKETRPGTAFFTSVLVIFEVEDGSGNWFPIQDNNQGLNQDNLAGAAHGIPGVYSSVRQFNVAGYVNFRVRVENVIVVQPGTGTPTAVVSVQASPAISTATTLVKIADGGGSMLVSQGEGPLGPFTPWFMTIMDIDGVNLMPVGADVTTCIFTRAILIDENGDPRGVSPASAPYTKSIVVNDSGVSLGQAQVQGVYVNSTPITSPIGGSTPFRRISTASTNAVNVKASAGTLYMLIAVNTNASPRYLKLYDSVGAPVVGTDTPIMTLTIPGNTNGGGFSLPIPSQGIAFANGISYAMTTGVADGDVGAVAANEITLNGAFS